MTHILRTSTEYKTASLADEGNSACCSLAAHTTLNTYKPMEINIERSPQHSELGTFCSRERYLNHSATAPRRKFDMNRIKIEEK